jgi:hypothetical protein
MLKERLTAIKAVKSDFLAAERAQDDAAIAAARCVATMLEMRRASNLPLGLGLDAIAAMARAVTLSIETRASIIRAHPMLAELPAQIGVSAYGDGLDCPPLLERVAHEERPSLRAVA